MDQNIVLKKESVALAEEINKLIIEKGEDQITPHGFKGIILSALPRLYNKKYNKKLNFVKYGFESISSFLRAFPDMFLIHKEHAGMKEGGKSWIYLLNEYQSIQFFDGIQEEIKTLELEIHKILRLKPDLINKGILLPDLKRLLNRKGLYNINFNKLGFNKFIDFLENCKGISIHKEDNGMIFAKYDENNLNLAPNAKLRKQLIASQREIHKLRGALERTKQEKRDILGTMADLLIEQANEKQPPVLTNKWKGSKMKVTKKTNKNILQEGEPTQIIKNDSGNEKIKGILLEEEKLNCKESKLEISNVLKEDGNTFTEICLKEREKFNGNELEIDKDSTEQNTSENTLQNETFMKFGWLGQGVPFSK